MKNDMHLSEKTINRYLSDPTSIPEADQNHIQTCDQCQKSISLFAEEIREVAESFDQNTIQQRQARQRFWKRLKRPQQPIWLSKGALVGATLCVLCIIGITLTINRQQQPLVAQIVNQNTEQQLTLLQFASAITPGAELVEPAVLSFIMPEQQESSLNKFEDFIFFVTSATTDQSS